MSKLDVDLAAAAGRVTRSASDQLNIEGSHETEGMAGVQMKTDGDFSASLTRAKVSGDGSASAVSFKDVMAAKPSGDKPGSGEIAKSVKATAKVDLGIKIGAEAAVTAVGKAVETKNEGEVKSS